MALKNLSEDSLQALWDAGVPLSKAWRIFAEPSHKAQWAALSKRSATQALAEGAELATQSEGSLAEKLSAALAGPQEILTQRAELQKLMRSKLLVDIANGQLHGVGFEPPRTLDDAPVLIPSELWKGRCDWDQNKLCAHSLELIEVRLLTTAMRDEALDQRPPGATSGKVVGRPPIGRDVKAAIAFLKDAGHIDVSKSRQSHYGAIRYWLHRNRPNLRTPAAEISDETIRGYFSPVFNALKESKKQ